ncbi:MAG: group I truncated hemoglobin [Gammaproteobacteria bacterium]|jgi:hemoglobin
MRARCALAVALATTLALSQAACAGMGAAGDFERFGGMPGIRAVVEDAIVRSVEDPRIAHHFAGANLVRLHDKLSEQICVELGGPCVYTGFPMAQAHAGRDIREADFNALVEHLVEAMEAHAVPRPAQNRLLARLARMRGDVIER